MDLIIRKDKEGYMKELKAWLRAVKDDGPEEMGRFFEKRVDGYEEHMSVWKGAYCRFASLLAPECRKILDLGCGTGLELDEIWKRDASVSVTGVDLCSAMLERLKEKHGDKPLEAVCMDYFRFDMGEGKWDAVISFESLHHFLPEQKGLLYDRIYKGLKAGGSFLLGDYIACCDEEETLLRSVCLEKRERFMVPADAFIHFDIPLTLEHELELLRKAGFAETKVWDCIEGATLIEAKKGKDF